MSNRVTIAVYITEDEAIKAGLSLWGEKTYEIDPSELSEDEREILLSIPHRNMSCGNYRTMLSDVNLYGTYHTIDVPLTAFNTDTLRAYLKRYDAVKSKVEADLCAKDLEDIAKAKPGEYGISRLTGHKPYDDDTLKVARADLQKRDKEAIVAYEAEKAEKKRIDDLKTEECRKKREADELTKQKARTACMVKYVLASGTESQKARLDAGFLPQKEVKELIESILFVPLDEFPLYEPITAMEFREQIDEYVGDVDFSVSPKTELSEVEFACLQKIQSALSGRHYTAEVVEHKAFDNDADEEEDATITRSSVRVTISTENKEFTFTRDYAIR
jgi:hypothetical protein